MTNNQIAEALQALNVKLDGKFDDIDRKFTGVEHELEKINLRLDQTVTKSDVTGLIFQSLAYTAALIVGTVIVLNILSPFTSG